jgi:membrane protease YdiL (CAAX protease family)
MQKKTAPYDWFTVFVVIALLLIPLYSIPEIFLFRRFGEFSIYGFVVSLFLVLGFLEWTGFLSMLKRGINKHFLENLILPKFRAKLGFRRSWAQVAIGSVVGACLGLFTCVLGASPSNSLGSGWVLGNGVMMVFLAPLIEETLFRGYLINRCISSGGGRAWTWALATVASVFLFSFSHAHNPEWKIVTGAVLTLIYLWRRRNNLTATIMTHAIENATIFLSAFLVLGFVGIVLALVTIIITVTPLVSVIWTLSPPPNGSRRNPRLGFL